MPTPFVPTDFVVPATLETAEFRLRMLTVNDVVKDYDAVMTSVAHLQGVFGPHNPWPRDNLTFEQDLIDLGWHQKEFQTRRSFAYTMMSLDESRCLGCVYFYPSEKVGYDAMAILWVRGSEQGNGLDGRLLAVVRDWLARDWPFERVGFPGRDIPWAEWLALGDRV
jgi:hypothetical protein